MTGPSDDEQFTAADVAELLRAVPDPNVVVVGGQAVNAFTELYIAEDSDLAAEAPFTSKDFDVYANRGELLRWQRELGERASVQLPDPNHMGAVQNGILRYRLDDERTLKVDFMTTVYGVSKGVVESAVPVTLDGDGASARILNPVLCVQSRIANVVGLPHIYDNAHGLKQLRASIVSCRHFLEDLAMNNRREALNHVEQLFQVTLERKAAKLYREKGLDPFAALPPLSALPEAFRERRHPQMLQELAKKRRRPAAAQPR